MYADESLEGYKGNDTATLLWMRKHAALSRLMPPPLLAAVKAMPTTGMRLPSAHPCSSPFRSTLLTM